MLILGLIIIIPISEVRYLDYGRVKLIFETERMLSERGIVKGIYTLEEPT
jgi:hypothetical protein